MDSHGHTEALLKDVPEVEVVEAVGELLPVCSMSCYELDSGCTNCCLPARCSYPLPGSQRGIVTWVSAWRGWQGGRFL